MSVKNMVITLSEKFGFFIYTRDRDFGDLREYSCIERDCWLDYDSYWIYYRRPGFFSLLLFMLGLDCGKFDTVYFNSFFSLQFTIIPLLWLILFPSKRLCFVIAPRGELGRGALNQKTLRKRFYLWLFRSLILWRFRESIYLHASTNLEAIEFQQHLNIDIDRIFIAQDLPDASIIDPLNSLDNSQSRESEVLNLVYVSRITPKKNLNFLLQVLLKASSRINLNIYGPIDDESYYLKCLRTAAQVPHNVSVKFYGPVSHDEVHLAFSNAHLFAFPTLSENYGHVIIESLTACTPVLVSPYTPWNCDEQTAIAVLPLIEQSWLDYIDSYLITRRSDFAIQSCCKEIVLKIRSQNTFHQSCHIEMFQRSTTAF